jgi:integrase
MAWLKVTNLQLTREVVSGYLDAHYGHDPSNFNQALSAVKRLANQAAHNGWLDWQIAHSIDTIKSKVVRGARAGNWLSLPQAKRLLNAPGTISVSGKRDKAVLALLLGCGIRREELSEALVKQFAEREGRYYLLDLHGKGGRIRTVAVPPWAVEVVLEWLAVYAAKENAPLVCSFLFNGGFRGKLSVSAIWDIVSHWSKRTGVPIAPHDLRRTYSRLARDQGAPIEVIQKSLGHSNIATTQRYLGATDQANAGDWFEV